MRAGSVEKWQPAHESSLLPKHARETSLTIQDNQDSVGSYA